MKCALCDTEHESVSAQVEICAPCLDAHPVAKKMIEDSLALEAECTNEKAAA